MSWQDFCKNYKVPKKFLKCSLETIYDRKEEIEKFLDEHNYSLILHGEPGRGKTFFLYTLIQALLEVKKAPLGFIRFFSGVDLEDRMRMELKEFRSAKYLVESLVDEELLFIDDFGVTSMVKEAESHYYKLLDMRLNDEKPTIISTNLDDTELLHVFGKRIFSRLKFCRKINFENEDLRS